jgi:hypothetical protein
MFATFMAGLAKGVVGILWLILAGDFKGPLFKCRGERDNNVSFST